MNLTEKSKRIYMAKIWKSEEIVWKREGFLKKYENIYGTNRTLTEIVKEFIWQKYGKLNNYMEMWRIFKEKWKIYGNMMNSSGKVKEFIWSNSILSIGFLTSTVL